MAACHDPKLSQSGPTQVKLEQQQEGMSKKLELRMNEEQLLAKKEEILITHYVNPELFAYITLQQLKSCGPLVNRMEAQLPPHCQPDQQLEHYAPEQYVIVRFLPWQRDKFLRGLVKLYQQGEYLVWAIDYGITINCRAKDMWRMPPNLCEKCLQISWGGVAGVAPTSGTTWSKIAIGVLNKRLDEAKLHYRISNRRAEHSFGELVIESLHQEEPLLDAANYLLDKHCAIRQERTVLSCVPSIAYDMELAELNDAEIRPSKRCIIILEEMCKQRQQHMPLNPYQQLSAKVAGLANPAMHSDRLDTLLQARRMPSVPESAMRLSVVKSRHEASVETALYNGCSKSSSNSCSTSSSGHDSNCSSDSLESAKVLAQPLPRISRNILDFYRRPTIPPRINEKIMKATDDDLLHPRLAEKENEKLLGGTYSIEKVAKDNESQPASAESRSKELSELVQEANPIEKESIRKLQENPLRAQPEPTKSMSAEVSKLLRDVSLNEKKPQDKYRLDQDQAALAKSQVKEQSNRIPKAKKESPKKPQGKLKPKQQRAQSIAVNSKTASMQQVLAHSAEQVQPIAGVSESKICHDVQKAMLEMDIRLPMPSQRYAWPHLMAGNSLLLVDNAGRGRSWCYLPALCSLVMESMRAAVAGVGPMALLLTDTAEQAGILSNHCKKLMQFYETQYHKVVNTHEFPAHEDVQLMLLNSCGILVTTPMHLQQLLVPGGLELISARRLKYFILDDYDRMRSELLDVLPLISALNPGRLQLMLVAQQWHMRVFPELINRLANNPLLLFGDFLKAAIYGNLKLDIALLRSDKKIAQLIQYLDAQKIAQRRIAIYCKHEEELVALREALMAAGHECIGASDAAKQQTQQLLLLTDALHPSSICRNMELMVHYSLPDSWTKFSQRFQGFSDKIPNYCCPEEKTRSKGIMSYVLLDESNSYEFPRLVEFLDAHEIKLSEQIYKMVAHCRLLTDQNRALCPQLLSRGECMRPMSCQKRHFAIDSDLQPNPLEPWQPNHFVRCKLLKICSPVHFVVMAESYSSDGFSWQDTSNLSHLRKLSTDLCMHLSLEQNRRIQQKLSIADICVVQRGLRFQRVRILDLSDRRLVTVQLMDEGTKQVKVKPAELLECEQRFKAQSALAMDVRLCGISPAMGQVDNWQPEATKWVNEALGGLQENQQLQLNLAFSMFHVAYAKELTVLQQCPTMRTSVKAMQLSKELIKRGFARQEEKTLKKLNALHEQWQREHDKREEKQNMNGSKQTIEISLEEETSLKLKSAAEPNADIMMTKEKSEKEGNHPEEFTENSDSESDDIFFDSESTVGTSPPPSGGKMKQFLSAVQDYLLRRNRKVLDPIEAPLEASSQVLKEKTEEMQHIAIETATPAESTKVDSASVFLDVLLQDLCSSEQTLKDSTKLIVQELLGGENPRESKKKKEEEQTARTEVVSPGSKPSCALLCGIVAGNVVRPKVRWHQTLMQIELIFEQTIPQYQLLHQRNVLIYEVNETTPPQRCILNLLGEVRILSEKQHGYQLHVKLAKQGLTMYWPTLLSSLAMQQHCHWLIYDTERGKLAKQDTGRINWLRYERNQYKEQTEDYDYDASLSADEDSELTDVERVDSRGDISDF